MVHIGYVSVIKDLLTRESDHWRSTCCDSGCDPCIQTLVRVVDELSAGMAKADPIEPSPGS